MSELTEEDFVVRSNDGLVIIKLNPKFNGGPDFKGYECPKTMKRLHTLFRLKESQTAGMASCPVEESELLQIYDRGLEETENLIQKAYGFEPNADFHRYWERPHCSCPSMDNSDRWGTGYNIIAGNCPVHGFEVNPDEEPMIAPEVKSLPSFIATKIHLHRTKDENSGLIDDLEREYGAEFSDELKEELMGVGYEVEIGIEINTLTNEVFMHTVNGELVDELNIEI